MTYWTEHTGALREHIRNKDAFFMSSITFTESITTIYFMTLKQRGMMPKLKEIKTFTDFKCWLLGHLIKSIHFK